MDATQATLLVHVATFDVSESLSAMVRTYEDSERDFPIRNVALGNRVVGGIDGLCRPV